MDDRSIEKIMKKRERGYIWLEKELKYNLTAGVIAVAVLFAAIRVINPEFRFWVFFFLAALFLEAVMVYANYKKEYSHFEQIFQYLEHYEAGDYQFHIDDAYMKRGIRSQVTDRLETLGRTFEIMKRRLVAEKENTKELVTDITHQLKTPLSALKMSLELMEDKEVTEEEREEFLVRAKKEADRLSVLMESLTNLSRLEADMIRLKPVEASLKETIVRAVNGVYLKANAKKIEIEMEDVTDISIPHDPRWTAEAISNVLDNAVKYSGEGSRVQIRVVPQISYVLIEVEDEGIGIPKAEYPDIFKRFYRGKNPLVQRLEGSGVGLYLVRQILEEQGGSIRALPAAERGAVFQMMLPKSRYLMKDN